jgi:hypothetical protein
LKFGVQEVLQAEPVVVVAVFQVILVLMCGKPFVFVLEVMCVALQDFPVQTQAIYKPEAAVRAHVFAG